MNALDPSLELLRKVAELIRDNEQQFMFGANFARRGAVVYPDAPDLYHDGLMAAAEEYERRKLDIVAFYEWKAEADTGIMPDSLSPIPKVAKYAALARITGVK
jgi:hypothetical protein